MNARIAIQENEIKVNQLLDGIEALAERKGISVEEAINFRVKLQQRLCTSDNAKAAWDQRGEDAKDKYNAEPAAKTIFKSQQYGISNEQLANYFDNYVEGVEELKLLDVSIRPSGHGHYSVKAELVVDGGELTIKTVTSDTELIDNWKSYMADLFEPSEDDYYESGDDLVKAMLSAIEPDEQIRELVVFRD